MAGKIVVSTLNNDTGVLATQNGMTGIAKAWLTYNAETQAILSSFNVSSVTYTSIGRYTVNLTTAMPNINYCVNVTFGGGKTNGTFPATPHINESTYTTISTPTTTAFNIRSYIWNDANSFLDMPYVCVAVFSS